ncbi:MAG TPA: hypothetical protein VFF29_05220, partial [Bacteroidota bacterium]|nr:hypothetical protein [Bacteroidota bacterium]
MSNVKVLLPRENLVHAAAQEIDTSSGANLSNYIVVFPGKRPAHFLRKALTEQYSSSFIPPRIFSIDNFVDFIARNQLGINKPQIDVLDAVSILYDVHLHANPKLGVEYYTTLDSFLPVGIKLFQELEEVMLANLPLNRIRDALIGIQYPKYHSLAYYYESFYAQIERRKLITRSLLYRTISEHISKVDVQQYKKIILAGFYAFTGVEKEFFHNLSKRKNVSFLFQQGPGLKAQLGKIGISIDSDLDSQQNGIPNIHFYKTPDTHGQAFGLATLFKQKIDSGNRPDSRSVVVVPSAMSLFPIIHFPLSFFKEEEYNIALGYPLVRTPVYGFINSLMDLIAGEVEGKYSAELYVKFVLHPYTKNIHWKNRSDVTRILFHTIEQYLAERGANALLTLETLENDTLLFERTQQALSGLDNVPTIEEMQIHLREIHDKTIRRFQHFASIGDFGKQVSEV